MRHCTGPVANRPSRILGPLQVSKDPYHPAGLVAGLPNHRVDLRMVSVGAVAEVEASDVHASPDQLSYLLRGRRDRADRTDDLRASMHGGRTWHGFVLMAGADSVGDALGMVTSDPTRRCRRQGRRRPFCGEHEIIPIDLRTYVGLSRAVHTLWV